MTILSRKAYGGGAQAVDSVFIARETWDRAVERGAVLPATIDNRCWDWQRTIHRSGYGQVRQVRAEPGAPGRLAYAHVVAYVAATGSLVPEGMVVDHICRNRKCCRFNHLLVATARGNQLAPGSESPAAASAARERCPKGHALIPAANVGRARRWCHTCRKRAYFVKRGLVAEAARTLGLTQAAYASHYGEGRDLALAFAGLEVLRRLESEAETRYPSEGDR